MLTGAGRFRGLEQDDLTPKKLAEAGRRKEGGQYHGIRKE
jgi:hypothetical protein